MRFYWQLPESSLKNLDNYWYKSLFTYPDNLYNNGDPNQPNLLVIQYKDKKLYVKVIYVDKDHPNRHYKKDIYIPTGIYIKNKNIIMIIYIL